MPLYDFFCDSCGPYEVQRTVSAAPDPAPCPACRADGRRVFHPPGIVRTPAGMRRARDLEESSAHEPSLTARPEGRPLHVHAPHRDHHHHAPPWATGGC
jgi:putative FmdB family regulatory protein